MKQDELKLVFDALKQCNAYAFAGGLGVRATAHTDALAILEKALAQPEQEPVAWRAPNWSNLHGKYGYRDFDDPVCGIDGKPSPNNEPLYTHSQRTWVGLTDVEIDYLLGSTAGENEETHISFARAIEAKLKELNDHGI
jgi:hypothetical protein